MDDERIVALFWARDERAIAAAADAYGGYCHALARNILGSEEDAQECVNDTLLRAWNAIPPERPERMGAYLAVITRNAAFRRWREQRADKRGGGVFEAVLDELEGVASGAETVEQAVDAQELTRAIEAFLRTQPRETRQMFLCRYFYADGVGEIAKRLGRSEGSVSVTLYRTREKLRSYLKKEGFSV